MPPDDLAHGATFTAKIDLVEWMGSELYVYFTVGGGAAATELGRHADLSADDVRASGEGTQVVARLERASQARPGEELELWLDARALHLFDPDTGERLSRDPRAETSPGPAAADPPPPAQEQGRTEAAPAAPAAGPSPPADAPTG